MDIVQLKQQARQTRINKLKNTIEDFFASNLMLNFDRLISECCLKTGCSSRTIKEDLKLLQVSMGFYVYDGFIMNKVMFNHYAAEQKAEELAKERNQKVLE